jgi:hypothetical protein
MDRMDREPREQFPLQPSPTGSFIPDPFANPTANSIHSVLSNPFSRAPSRPTSTIASSSALDSRSHRFFHSRRVEKGSVPKPWLEKKDPREKWVSIIPFIGLLVGVGLAGLLIWRGFSGVVNHKYCPVLMEDFTSGNLDSNIWTKEVEVGGYG